MRRFDLRHVAQPTPAFLRERLGRGTRLPLPLLVTGITGVAGFNAFHYLSRRFPGQVVGIRPQQTWQLRGPGIVAVNAEDRAALGQLFRAHRFRAVLNCTGNCALKSCELDPVMARQLNVESVANVLDCSAGIHARLVHLSSDLVFSGVGTGNYTEDAVVDPVTIYGKTMAEGEALVQAADPEAAILRISLPMGPSFNRHAGAIDWIDSRFRAGRPATLYFDEVRSCTYVGDLNPVFDWFLCGEETGVFHLGGPKPATLYEIGQIVNRVGGYSPQLLRGHPRIDAGPMPPRAGNVSMNSAKLIAVLGENPFHAWPAEADLWPNDRLWHFDRPLAEQRGRARIVSGLYQFIGKQPAVAVAS
jgi:dTDP-4-dehydrorhamnose reductase